MNERQRAKMWNYGKLYGASPGKISDMIEPKVTPVEEHGPRETVRLEYFLPFEWLEAKAAFQCCSDITLTDVAKDAISQHIQNTMSMYKALKEARDGNAQSL